MATESKQFDLGLVTAYAYAVSKGYTGTEEEFATLMASYATVAEAAAAAAAQAAASASEAAGSAADAATSVEAAASHAEDAEDSADDAALSASAAEASANSASNSVTAAAEKASEAAASATAASGSADTAAQKATEAAGSATTAGSQAGAAAASATAANASKVAAQAAQAAAETAQGAAEAAAEQAEETLNSYAKVDGSYSSMTVGNAEQLVATVAVEDSVPYNFRTSGGTADIGDREVDKLVGGTVAWNQAINKNNYAVNETIGGVTFTNNADGSVTATASGATSETVVHELGNISPSYFVDGHKYFIQTGFVEPGSSNTYEFMILRGAGAGSNLDTYKDRIVNLSISGSPSTDVKARLVVRSGATITSLTLKPQVFDLTQMFGSTIADYIYSLETATPGGGVAWFRKLFPKPYYAYNPGELMSVQTAAHKMVGFNAWDEEWQTYGASQIKAKNRIPVIAGATYYAKCSTQGLSLYFFESADGSSVASAAPNNSTFTVPENCHFMMLYTNSGYGNVYNHDICINLSWDGERDGEYEPYAEYTYPLDDSLTLRGIPKLDSGNALYYDGDTYESDGTVTRRYGIVDLGTLTWAVNGSYEITRFYSQNLVGLLKAPAAMTDLPALVTAKYRVITQKETWAQSKTIAVTTSGIVYIMDADYTNAATFKAAMSGVYLVYELAEPTTETADPFQSPQIVDDFGTEEYVDAGVAAETRDVAIPVGHDTFYQANLRAKLEMSPDSPDGDGDYIVRQTNGTNAYVPLMKELPTAPTTEGTYHLKATVTSGGVTLTWEADT